MGFFLSISKKVQLSAIIFYFSESSHRDESPNVKSLMQNYQKQNKQKKWLKTKPKSATKKLRGTRPKTETYNLKLYKKKNFKKVRKLKARAKS